MGRRATPRTVKILKTGEVRLSPDLCIARTLYPKAFRKEKIIRLRMLQRVTSQDYPFDGCKVYYTNKRARSGRISLGPYIRMLGLEPRAIAGKVYKADVEDDQVAIHFNGKGV